MCRFVLYMGPPITLDLLTTRPAHSIIRQSFQSRMMEEPLNGDGFGIAWYVPDISPQPAQFRSIQPAWNNVNLLHLARVSRGPVILAHVRAATLGFGVTESNCHPFAADQFAFMHNGSVADFRSLKRRLCESLSDETYQWIHGTTDSEHLFALFRDHAKRLTGGEELQVMADALAATIGDVERLTQEVGATRRSLLNLVISDGRRAVVSRYATDDSGGPSLYLRTGKEYVCQQGVCRMVDDGGSRATVIVASEPLTEEPGWEEVPPNHLLLVDSGHRVEMREIGPTKSNPRHLSKSRSERAYSDASDEQLLVSYRDGGDVGAFETLVHRYEKPIYNYLLRYLRNAPLAEEVFQTTFLRLHEKCDHFDEDRLVRPWLYSIATNQAIDALRKEGKHQAVRLDEKHAVADADVVTLLNVLESGTPSPFEQAEEHERAEWTRKAVDGLPDHQRVAVLLIFFQGLKYREVAEILQVPEGTIKSRIHKALLALNKAWRRDHGGTDS